MEPKNIAIVCMFVAVALGLLATAFAFPSDTVERFEERETETEPAKEKTGIKLHVIEMFNLLLDRNPSPDEITKYGAMKDKDAVSRHIIEDYSSSDGEEEGGGTTPVGTGTGKKATVPAPDVKSIGRRLRALADEIDPRDMLTR